MAISSHRFYEDREYIVLSLLVQAVMLTLIALVLLVFPSYGSLLPGMNLVFSTFGHSHIAAVIILMLPISYFMAGKSNTTFGWLVPVLLLLGLVTSFGRTAITIALLQTVVFLIASHKYAVFKQQFSKGFRLVLAAFAVILIAVFALKVLLSFNTGSNLESSLGQWLCDGKYGVEKLCKDIRKEPRPIYWQQALTAVRQYPVTGYGPGTFTLINEKLKVNQGHTTSYAHNAYLEVFAETGVVGGITFLLLVGSLLWFSLKAVRAEKHPQKKVKLLALWLAVSGMCLNVFFDFDWNFRGVFLLTMLVFALLFIEARQQTESTGFSKSGMIVPKLVMAFPALLSVLFIIGSILVDGGRISALAVIFKDNPQSVLASINDLSSHDKKILTTVYEQHPEAYSQLIEKETDVLKKHGYSQKLMEIAPWRGVYVSQAQLLIDNDHYTEAEVDLLTRVAFILEKEAQGMHPLPYEEKKKIVDQLIRVANYYYTQGQAKVAGEYYQQAYYLDPWSLSRTQPIFTTDTDPEKLAAFLPALVEIESQYLNEYRGEYAQAYLQLARIKSAQEPAKAFEQEVATALKLDAGLYWLVKDEFLPLTVNEVHRYIQSGNLVQAKQLLDPLNTVINTIGEQEGSVQALYYADELANFNVYVGNWLYAQESIEAGRYYLVAQQLYPQVLTSSNAAVKLWLEEEEWREKSVDELQAYAQVMAQLHLTDVRAPQEHVELLQFLAVQYAQSHQPQQAEAVTALMQKVLPTDYWVMVQLANWYVANQELDNAREAYQACLDMAPDHTDCLLGIEALEASSYKPNRYYEVAQIILGEKTYHDFE